MANTKIILDTRREKSDGSFNVVIRVTHFKKVYTINSGVLVMDEFSCKSIVYVELNINLLLLKNFN